MDIKLYTTLACRFSLLTKQFFIARSIPFTENDVLENKEALDEMVRLTGGLNTPVIVNGPEIVVGYSEPRLEQLVECAKNRTTLQP